MKFNPQIHHRRSIRLKEHEYARADFYFITLCCQNRACLFGEIQNDAMLLNDAGKMVENEWLMLKTRFQNIELQSYVLMPNHFHGILEIVKGSETVQPQGIAPTKTIGDMMDAYKSTTTVKYIHGVKNLGWMPFDKKIWQRNYYEHIIRNESEYLKISDYIANNPARWADDDFHTK